MNRMVGNLVMGAAVLVALSLYGCEQRKRGAAEAMVQRTLAENDSLRRIERTVEVRYRRDTVTLWRSLTRYDSVRITDTITRNDTVFVPRIVADHAIAACRATVLTCEERVGIRDQRIAALESAFAAQPKPRSVLWMWVERGVIGFGAFKLGQAVR